MKLEGTVGEPVGGRMRSMARRRASIDRAARRIDMDLRHVLDDVAAGRRANGLSLRAIEGATGVSKSAIDRLESYRGSVVDLAALAAVAAAIGQDLRLRLYPTGDAIRDAGQQRVLERLRVRIHQKLRW